MECQREGTEDETDGTVLLTKQTVSMVTHDAWHPSK